MRKTFCNVNEMFNFSKEFRFKLEPLAQGTIGMTPPLEKLVKKIHVRKEIFTFTTYLRTHLMPF